MVETFFTEKRIIKKIIIVLIFIFMFNFTFSYLGNNVVFAEEYSEGEEMSDADIEDGGGKLLLPIHSFVLFVADAILELMQNSFVSQDNVTIKAYSKDISKVDGWAIAGIVIGVTVLAIACVVTYGAVAAAVPAVTAAVAGTTGAAAIGAAATSIATAASTFGGVLVGGIIFGSGAILGIAYSADSFIDNIKGEFDLPTIQYTPEAIFSNRIPLFDINFFNPSEEIEETVKVNIRTSSITERIIGAKGELIDTKNLGSSIVTKPSHKKALKEFKNNYEYDEDREMELEDIEEFLKEATFEGHENFLVGIYSQSSTTTSERNILCIWYDEDKTEVYIAVKSTYSTFGTSGDAFTLPVHSSDLYLYKIILNEPEEIKEILSNAQITEESKITYQSAAKELQGTVSSMYKTLRTVAIVSLLTILVYVGIRMVISSTSKDKAKYKQMLMDWLVAFIMLFVLHYMMAFIIDISEKLTEICNKSNIENVPIRIPNGTQIRDDDGKLQRLDNGDGSPDIWGTNFMGAIRFKAGLVQNYGYTVKGISYTIMYVVLVIYVAIFTFQYMKRVLYMAFLTMIAPLVAITYPLDKINDGKAQGFSMWLREYIFNALLQPIHYIIYVVIMGSVMNMIVSHPVYALVALGFMVPAEKFIRKMFGFEKASTVGAFGGAAGAAMLMGGIQKLTHRPSKKKDNNEAKGSKDNPTGKIRTVNSIPKGPGGSEGTNNPIAGVGNAITSPGRNNTEGDNYIRMANNRREQNGVGTDNERGQRTWDSRLTPEQKDELMAEGIAPGDQEYDMALRNYGIRPEDSNSNERAQLSAEEEYYRSGTASGYSPEDQMLWDMGIDPSELRGKAPSNEGTTVRDLQEVPKQPLETISARMPDRSWEQSVPQPGDPYFIGPLPKEKRKLWNRFKTNLAPVGRGISAVGGHYVRRLDNRLRKAHPLRALRRGLTYGLGAATLGAIGLAAGIASGDPSKAFQYTTAGAIAGGNLGKNLGETASNVIGLEGATKAFKAGALGDSYGEMEREKYKRDFKNNVSNYDVGVRNVTAKGWREMSKEGGIIDTGIDYGINNVDDLSNIYLTQKKFMSDYGMKEDEAQDLAFKAYKLDKQFGDYSSNSKTRENLDKILKANGYTDDEQRRMVTEGMVNTMKTYQKVSLDEGIKEPTFDYTRMSSQAQQSGVDTPPNTPPNTPPRMPNTDQTEEQEERPEYIRTVETNGMEDGSRTQVLEEGGRQTYEGGSDDNRDDDRDDSPQTQPTMPITETPQEDPGKRADAVNAETEAFRERKRQEDEMRRLQEENEQAQKKAEAAQEQAKAADKRARYEGAVAKRKNMEERRTNAGVAKTVGGRKISRGDKKKESEEGTIPTNLREAPPVDRTSPVSSDLGKGNVDPIKKV